MAERINGLIRTGEFGVSLDETPFLCECSNPGCHAVVWLAPEEFDDLRSSGSPVLKDGLDLDQGTASVAEVIALTGGVGVDADRALAG